MKKNSEQPNEKPPILGNWRNFYGLVIAVLVLLIIIFYLITNHYA